MSNYNTIHFKILSDSCSSEDLLEDRTHGRIADKLYEIISADASEGMTIGLEGEWGSGKSTVVKLLQEKLKAEAKDKSFVFYIDAWEHEGDHLRRVFLETLIEKIKAWRKWGKDTIVKLDTIADRITSKKVSKKVEHSSQMTSFGKTVAFATLLVPLGASLLTVFAEQVTMKWTGIICWEFWGSFLLTMAPVLVYLGRWLCCLCSPKDKRFALLETEANVDTIYETSREEERSSVEFERYFSMILQAVASDIDKIVLVIDNLDRVAPKDALRIWATLQTFVQYKNPTTHAKLEPCTWIIVPYSHDSLSRIWEEQTKLIKNENALNSKDNQASSEQQSTEMPISQRAESFMDKSFQLRLHVPKMVISGWKAFARKCIEDAAPSLESEDVAKILNVLSWTRTNLTDAPSPRQIKIYINQVGLLYSLHGNRVPLEAICFYVVKKYLNGLSDKQLEADLREKRISATSLPQYTKCHELASEVAAILYGVEEDKAMQILLAPVITDALRKSDSDKLIILHDMHSEVFYDVLNYILKFSDSNLIPKFAGAIQKAFHASEVKAYSSALNALRLAESVAIDQMQSTIHDDAIAIIDLASTDVDKDLVEHLAKAYALDLPKRFRSDAGTTPKLEGKVEYIDNPSELVQHFTDVSSAAKRTITIPYECFKDESVDFSKFSAEELKELTMYMNGMDIADDDIAEQIQDGKPIPEWVGNLYAGLTRNGMTATHKTLEALSRSFAWNNGQRGNGIYSHCHWNILMAMEFIDKEYRPIDEIKALLLTKGYWFFNDFPNNQTAFLLAKYHGELTDQELTPRGLQSNRVNQYRKTWNTKNSDLGSVIYQYASYSQEFDWLAREAAKQNRALIGSVVEAALDANEPHLFDVGLPFEFFAHLFHLVDEAHHQMLVDNFVSNNTRLMTLSDPEDEKLVDHPRACLKLLVAISGNDAYDTIVAKIKSELSGLAQDEWSLAFKNSNDMAELVGHLVQNGKRLDLANPFAEALKDFICNRIKSAIDCSLSPETLTAMHKAMKPVLQSVFASGIGNALKDTKFDIATARIKEFVLNFPNYDEWLADSKSIVKNMAAELSNAKHIEAFDNFITIVQRCGNKLQDKAEVKDIIEQPVQAMLKHEDPKVKEVGRKAAECFGVEYVPSENTDVSK